MKSKFAMEVYNPGGAVQVTNVHAPRLDTLKGKTIGEVTNGKYQFDRTFPVLREVLKKRFPDAKIIPYTEFPIGLYPGGGGSVDPENIGELAKEKGCDCVIVGNAG